MMAFALLVIGLFQISECFWLSGLSRHLADLLYQSNFFVILGKNTEVGGNQKIKARRGLKEFGP